MIRCAGATGVRSPWRVWRSSLVHSRYMSPAVHSIQDKFEEHIFKFQGAQAVNLYRLLARYVQGDCHAATQPEKRKRKIMGGKEGRDVQQPKYFKRKGRERDYLFLHDQTPFHHYQCSAQLIFWRFERSKCRRKQYNMLTQTPFSPL